MRLRYEREILKQIQNDIDKLERAKEENKHLDKVFMSFNKEINHLKKLADMIEKYDY